MAVDLCPGALRMNRAADHVAEGWNYFEEQIRRQISESNRAIDSLGDIDLSDVNFSAVINRQETAISEYLCTLPDYSTVLDGNWTHQDKPFTPSLSWDIANYVITNTPQPLFDETEWALSFPEKPTVPAVPAPGDAPEVGDYVIPEPPEVTNGDIVIPDPPTLRGITLPDPPVIDLPVWDVLAPDDTNIDAPSGSFSWAEDAYSHALLDKTDSTISWMLDGGTGIPDSIWNMIWDRAREQLSEERERAIEEAIERWAARGFSVPGGALNKQVDMVIERFDKLSAEQLRETAIKQAQLEVENLRFAVESGIKLESVLIDLWNKVQDRALSAAKAVYDVAIAIFNAKVSKYNADAQVYATKAQVHKTLIEAELANLEIYKAELEGQKLIGDLNQQDVAIYATRIDAMTKLIGIYVAQIDAVKAQVSVDKARIDAYAAEIGAYGERIRANLAEYEAYKIQVQAESSKTDLYKTQVAAFTARVDAWDKKQRNELAADDIEIKELQGATAAYDVSLKELDARIKQEIARVDTVYKDNENDIKAYDLMIKYAQMKGDIQTKVEELRIRDAADLQLRKYLAELDIAVKQADLQNRLQIDALKAAAQVQSQLAAATMSAVNLSASMSDSFSSSMSKSASCNQSVSV
jgi:hypothetical protein